MESDSSLSSDELAAYRRQLQGFCTAHSPTLERFRDGVSFKLNLSEAPFTSQPRHLSSTATCFESLTHCPDLEDEKKLAESKSRFSELAIKQPLTEWVSDGSAHIYCRCRTLPFVVNHLPAYAQEIESLTKDIFKQFGVPNRLAIGEAWENPQDWYPPNAFHTFWTLQLLANFETRFPNEYAEFSKPSKKLNIPRSREEMLLWAKQAVGYQIALHVANSTALDSDQLAWALSILTTFSEDIQTSLSQQDFVRQALHCLFQQQNPTGTWRTGAPLFHYLKAGNAYCYVFETFSVLLRAALTPKRQAIFLRQALLPYARNIINLWNYAKTTAVPVIDGKLLAWSSGHRANRTEPESWATASVYSFSQTTRRLLGIWSREAAARELRVPVARAKDASDPIRRLSDRGKTWTMGDQDATAADQLMTLFVNPIRCLANRNILDPDGKRIEKDQARSAILFGPPGTSKTTIAESVADAIEWDYLEIHSSHFVGDGLPNVQRTANRIFENLQELDQTVILFDEIDELVRSRGKEHDAFGRFLTTSMLPKLAELWKQRKVIYFIATNHISFFDPAVTRAQRFDALINVAPPALESKLAELERLLKQTLVSVTFRDINASDIEHEVQLAAQKQPSQRGHETDVIDLPSEASLAKFLLMRWDQIQELAVIIEKNHKTDVVIDRKLLADALQHLKDPSLRTCGPYRDFVEARKYEQQDFSKLRVWRVIGAIPEDQKYKFRIANGSNWWISQSGLSSFPLKYTTSGPGDLTITV